MQSALNPSLPLSIVSVPVSRAYSMTWLSQAKLAMCVGAATAIAQNLSKVYKIVVVRIFHYVLGAIIHASNTPTTFVKPKIRCLDNRGCNAGSAAVSHSLLPAKKLHNCSFCSGTSSLPFSAQSEPPSGIRFLVEAFTFVCDSSNHICKPVSLSGMICATALSRAENGRL